MTLPAGTMLSILEQRDAELLAQVFVNEIEFNRGNLPGTPQILTLREPLKLCTFDYLLARDSAELQLTKELQKLKGNNGSTFQH